VTFRLSAPDAQEVTLSGEWMEGFGASEKMVRNDEGVWSLTVGPLAPEFYGYSFNVDGVKALDPGNANHKRDGQRVDCILMVPGRESALYEVRDVPHGTLAKVWYESPTLDISRRMYVYTPPGYNEERQYPVLYLFGGSGELASTWSLFGRVNFISDNLIAEGKALPMIIVMPNNQVLHRMAPDHTERTFDLFDLELTTQVMPVIESRYSVRNDRHGRALAGLSMGGRHAQIVGLNNLDVFGSIGMLSGAESMELNPGVFEDPDLNDKIDYLFVGAGTNETRPDSRHVVFHEELEKRNIEHIYYIGSDGAHDFVTWRHLLYYQFLPNLWRTK